MLTDELQMADPVVREPTRSRIPWRRLAVESLVIIGSILAAFAVDRWWEARSRREEARVFLGALAGDFAVAEIRLDTARIAHMTVSDASAALITYGEAGQVPDGERARADSLVGRHFWRPTYDPPVGTLEGLFGSGRLDLIQKPELLTELTRWSSSVSLLRSAEADANAHFYDRIYPYLAGRVDLEDLDKGYRRFFTAFPWEQEPSGGDRIVLEQEFQSMLYMHWVLHTNALHALARVQESLDAIGTLVRDELER